jgi:hypothetical protein
MTGKPPPKDTSPRNLEPPKSVFFPVSRRLIASRHGETDNAGEQWEQIDRSPDVVERLALVLAGIDPVIQSDEAKHRGKRLQNLHQLRCDGGLDRISPSQALANDHRLLLWPCLQTSESQFAALWKQSRTIAGGQDSTLLIKQVHWLKKLNIAASNAAIGKASESVDLPKLVELSPKILFYLFRTAIRHIDRDCNALPPPPAPVSFSNRLLTTLGVQQQPKPPLVYFPSSILRETESYLETSLSLARVLVYARQHLRRRRA